MELSTQNLMKYIDQVSKLEASVYEQNKCFSKANAELSYQKPLKKEPKMPEKRTNSKPSSPPVNGGGCLSTFGIMVFIISIISLIVAILNNITILKVLGAILLIDLSFALSWLLMKEKNIVN